MEKPFAAYEGSEAFVFVCYAHGDADGVYPQITALREAGFNIWYDEGISPGSRWSDALARHIQRCSVFLYFVTPRSVQSDNCLREVSFALDQRCRIVAVHLHGPTTNVARQQHHDDACERISERQKKQKRDDDRASR